MADSEILTAQEFESFFSRLKATVARAGEADALEAAIARVVRGGEAPRALVSAKAAAKKPGRPAKKAAGARGPRRPPIDQGALVRELGKAKDGLSASQLCDLVGEKSRQRMLAALDKLREEGKVKLTGERRFARWHAA